MINHLRTLLLNKSGSQKPPPDYPGEEYVPAYFAAQRLPIELVRVYNILFGPSVDRAMMNYRLKQYMTLLHSSDLEPYVTDIDSRITYWPDGNTSLMNDGKYSVQIMHQSGSTNWVIRLTTDPHLTSPDTLLSVWDLTVQSDNLSALVVRRTAPFTESLETFTVSGTISSAIPLLGSTLSVVLQVGTGTPPSWTIQHLARPSVEIADIYENLKTSLVADSLFYGLSDEPYATCLKLWTIDGAPIAYKVGAVVLALAYRLDELYRLRR